MKERKNSAPPPPGPMMSMDKSKNMKLAYSNFLKYLGKFKWLVSISIVLSLIGAIFNLVGPGMLSDVTDLITQGLGGEINIAEITKMCVLLAALYGSAYVFSYAQGFIMATVAGRITQNMRRDISAKMERLPLKFFDTTSTGDILSRITNDIDTVGNMMNMSLSTLASSLALLAGSVSLMLLTNATLAVSGIATSLIGLVFVFLIIKKSQKHFVNQQKELGGLNGYIEEIYSGHTIVKVFNGEETARREFHERNEKLFNHAWKAQFMSGLMMPVMTFIGNLAYVVVCVIGAVLAVRGSITFGTIVAFMLYIRLFGQPLQNISQVAASIQSLAAACERVFEFLDEEEMENEIESSMETTNGEIIFQNVKFGYNEEKEIIKNLSAHVKPTQKIAIVGPTGAGKTTIVNLLMRFYEIDSGKISVDGVDIRNISRKNVHNLFGMVLQDTWLFEGTIRENILYNNNVSDEKLEEICNATGLLEMIKQMPNGYETVLNEFTSLSVGQKQLITIARVMAHDAPLLILDEATSSVDTRTELKVQAAMDKLMEGRTSFVIAHRLSTIKNADLILVMKDGDVIESGNHEELLASGGFYTDLYNSQFETGE
ncbi:MAG: ABC transporter ATP-binding protein/permease [Clostridiales bacterium]|jgi:ATP-binding cassette subfamily B protein|nr:ABC transporter ATP-binding protein/permease [Clostridiales bacterium]